MLCKPFTSEYPFSAQQIAFFQEQGYVQCNHLLSAAEVDLLRRDMDSAIAERKGFVRDLATDEQEAEKHDRILQMLNLWEHYASIRDFVCGRRLAMLAQRLSGSASLHLYHDQALIKPPGQSAASPWHQDQPYWPSKEAGMFSCWLALDDVTIDRGCMQFIPGSHRWGEFPPMSFQGDGPMLENLLSDTQKAQWKPVPVELKAGSCTFHHGLTFHYTRPNTTADTRRALVVIFIPDGITYAAEEKMENPFSDTITSPKGAPLRGTKFLQL